jgi:hypothetical protein
MRIKIFWNTKGVFILGLLIMLAKVLLIDMDPPSWKDALYQPVDEPYYAYLAYNFYETGDLFVADEAVIFGYSILLNTVTYLFLEIFGDNFLGLRFSSLFFGIVTLFFFVLLLKKITTNIKLQYAVVLFFVLNFSFTTANLIVETTMARMMAAILCLWLVVWWKENQVLGANIIWQSVVVCFLFIISYPTNAFSVLAAYIALVITNAPGEDGNIRLETFENFWKGSLYFALGGLISLFIYFLINLSLEVDVISDVLNRGSKYEDRAGFNFRDFVVNFFKIILANSFRFNPLWLVVLIIAISGVFLAKWKRMNYTVIVTLLFVGSFVLQTCFINDYPWRKLIILLPFLLLLTAYGVLTIGGKWQALKNRFLFSYVAVGLLALMLMIYWEQPFFNNHHFSLGIAILGLIVITFSIIKRNCGKMVQLSLFLILLLPEMFYTVQHYGMNQTYHYKNMYKSLSEYDGHNFIGGSSIGFRVYNETVPLLSKYLYYGRMDKFWKKTDSLSNNGVKDFSIDYDYMEEEFEDIGFKKVKILMPKENSVWDHDLVLYEEVTLK